MLVTIIILLAIASITYASNSVIQFRYKRSVFAKFNPKFWNPQISFFNKYKLDNKGNRVPKFFLSTTVLVWTTDAYHLLQFIYLSCVQLVIALLVNNSFHIVDNKIINCIFIFIGLKSIFSFSFEMLFAKLLINKSKV